MKYIKRVITIIFFTTIISISSICFAKENLFLETDVQNIEKEKTFKLYVKIEDIETASYTLNIYFDNNKVEYIAGPENTNVINNRIINIWYDEAGGKNTKKNQEIAVFEFKAKEEGISNFSITGEFFDKNGNKINTNNSHKQVNIIEKESNKEKSTQNIEKSNNSLLKIMRLNKEGTVPEFSPNINEYYFIAGLDINDLEVTAVSEAENANVKITGNQDLKEGLNKIQIEVTSSDNTSKSIYTINVTKTSNQSEANANLENLAIENATLEPTFDANILDYKASVASATDSINIFAVAENIKGKVEITGDTNLKEGDNIIKVKVIAPNGYTFKIYTVNVHRRTEKEDKKLEQEQGENAKKLDDIVKEKGLEFLSNDKVIANEENYNVVEKNNGKEIFIIMGLLIVVGIIIFVIVKLKKKRD